jgi:oligopeptide/dipeptide ABC transporter ATP-binding protein
MGVAVRSDVLEIRDLEVDFVSPERTVHAVRGLSFTLGAGEILGIVGESGCGKTTAALAILDLLPRPAGRIVAGSIRVCGQELVGLPELELRRVRGAVAAMVFQDPNASLNPVLSIGRQITEVLEAHTKVTGTVARRRARALLEMVGMPDPDSRLNAYPHQLSGGQRQRALIATALAGEPALLIADEPTTALDVTVQAQILELVLGLRDRTGMAILLITHNLGVVAGIADRTLVMYAGAAIEVGATEEVLAAPLHPYTAGLLRSVPRLDAPGSRLIPIHGTPPNMALPITGCAFRPRCDRAVDRCRLEAPVLDDSSERRAVACFQPIEAVT